MIHDLSSYENRELEGILDPSNTILLESRTEDNGVLQLQADYFEDERIAELNRKDNATIEENEDERS